MDHIYLAAKKAARRCGSRDPYDLLDSIKAITRISHDFSPNGLKGFATIEHHTLYAVINGNLGEYEKRIVAGHEAAHLILHREEILEIPARALQDFCLYTNNGRLEQQANRFLADFLVSDEMTLEAISNSESNYFATASILYLPPELLAFKLHSMMGRGLPVKNPVDLKSNFLRKREVFSW